jgi:hypothetical protein
MRAYLLVIALCGLSGCTSWALERTTLAHAESATDLRYRQVIENLAMILWNPDAVPAYSTIYSGTSDVNDNLKVTAQTIFLRTLHPSGYMTAFATESTDILGSRAVKGTWTLDPMVVPEKLRAMRAACKWVLWGPEHVGPDYLLLMNYHPPDVGEHIQGDPPGFYFFVVDRLLALPPGWLHCENRRRDVPRNACYWAGCHDRYVWVGAEGMEGFSQFVLAIQAIARITINDAFYPHPRTQTIMRSIKIDPDNPNVAPKDPDSDKTLVATVTLFLDADGRLTGGENVAAIPAKQRKDNVGDQSDLKSLINATSKSP